MGNSLHKNIFSVATAAGGNPTNRAIVTFEGCDKGAGHWECSKDTKDALVNGGACFHIAKSLEEFQSALDLDLAGEAEVDSAIIGASGFP